MGAGPQLHQLFDSSAVIVSHRDNLSPPCPELWTLVPNSPEKDQVTLILKKEGSSYTGSVSDSMGMANNASLEKVKIENGNLSFEFMVFNGEISIRTMVTLKIGDNKLTGSWSTEDGSLGSLELVRKKAAILPAPSASRS